MGSGISERFLALNVWQLKLGGNCLRFMSSQKTGLSTTKGKLLYVPPSEAYREDLDRKKPFLSGDLESSGLINEELPYPMSF